MKIGFNLSLEQKQQLIMTPKLQTAIKILQYNHLELNEYIEKELEENPLLEIIDSIKETDYKEASYESNINYDSSDSNSSNYENYLPSSLSLYEFLKRQLYQVLSASQLEIGKYIIGNLDNHGFLQLSSREIADKFDISTQTVKSVLKKIQCLEPVGIGAKNIQESLLIQLANLDLDTSIAEKIIRTHLSELIDKDYDRIARKMQVERDKFNGAINLIRTLNPYPVTEFFEDTKYIFPDIIIKKINGKFVVVSNERNSYSLKINAHYYQMLKSKTDCETSNYLNDKYQAALWLLKSIEQRRMTIFRIAQELIKKQKDFFNKGIKYLIPMTMSEIADKINMHESTVSRATTGKYVQTPHGLFEFKFFFSSGIKNISSVSIKAIISEYIINEDYSSPLSDSDLKKILKKEKNIDLSRRTIAKYRQQLNIPSYQKRRKKHT